MRTKCLRCGKTLHYDRYYVEALKSLRPEQEPKPGYKSNGIFCTLRCGYEYGLQIAKDRGA